MFKSTISICHHSSWNPLYHAKRDEWLGWRGSLGLLPSRLAKLAFPSEHWII